GYALLIVGLSTLIVLALSLSLNAVVNLVIVASFFSRSAVHVIGFHVRPEQVTAVLLFMKILFTHEKERMGSHGTRAVLAMVGVVLLNLIATVAHSPQPKLSY